MAEQILPSELLDVCSLQLSRFLGVMSVLIVSFFVEVGVANLMLPLGQASRGRAHRQPKRTRERVVGSRPLPRDDS